MSERINRIRKDITELDQYARRNKESIEKLKEQYEKAVKINECFIDPIRRNKESIEKLKEQYKKAVKINGRFIDRIKAMEKELFDLERGMCAIRNSECINCSWLDDEE